MKKNKEQLLNTAYDKFIDLVLGDYPIDRIDEIAVKDVMGYGTTIDEKLFKIEGLNDLVVRQREQGKGAEVNIKTERIFQKLFSNDEAALIVDEFQINMIIDGMKNVIPVRVSTVLEFINNNWKVIHWHGSVAVESEDDTWHINEWKQKNKKLQRLVDEQTADLVNKNHELEIEAALEKVRAVTLGMRNPDDMLNICQTISTQLHSLGIEDIRNVQTAIIYESKGTYLNYEYYRLHDKKLITEVDYHTHPTELEFANQMLKSKDAFFNTRFEGTELKKWMQHQKNASQFVDSYLYKAQTVNYYFFSLGPVAIGISTYSPMSDQNLQIFKRFRNVFGLAYSRYNDIKLAEEQAREAKIEAALERVRAVAMSMSNSEDLLKICEATFKELQELGFDGLRNAVIHIPNDEQKYLMDYDYSEFMGGDITKVEYGTHPIVDEYNEKMRLAKDSFFEIVIGKDQMESWKEYRIHVGQSHDQRLDDAEKLYYYVFSIGIGSIGISTFKPINDSKIKILKRFRNVFDLAYSRYNDIKLAEEQAKEAQIEAALERIRARAMGMHKSEEVGYVSDMLFSELNQLDFEINGSSIVIIDEEKDKMELWRARSDVAIKPFERTSLAKAMNILKKYIPDFFPKFQRAVKRQKGFLSDQYSGKRRLQMMNAIAEQYNYSNKEKNKLIENTPKTISTHYIFFKLGYLALLSERKLSEENISIVRRFVEVFDFSYTRFLDIKKAEAQARESEIQLALERVRSRTMAMQHSDELSDAAFLLAQQVRDLGINAWGCAFHIYADNEDGDYEWFSNEEGYLPFYKTPRKRFFKKYYEKRKKGEPLYVKEFKGEECENHYKYLMSLPVVGDALKDLQKSGIRLPESQIDHVAYFKYGYLLFITYEHVPKAYEIFKRFAKEFERTYTRFLDLKKAEAQARGAQIEAALEKVRSIALSMNKPEDMVNVCHIISDQLNILGIDNIRNVQTAIIDYDKATLFNYQYFSAYKKGIIEETNYKKNSHPKVIEMVKAMKKSEDSFFTGSIKGESLKSFREYRKSDSQLADPILDKSESMNYYFNSIGNGGLGLTTYKPLSDKEHDIFKRFHNVFKFSYKRFNDIQKNQAQAREAEIELALERVRARTMAMQNSDELPEAALLLFTQIQSLGIPAWSAGYNILESDKKSCLCVMSSEGLLQTSFHLPLTEEDSFREWFEAIQRGDHFFVQELGEKQLADHYDYLMKLPGVQEAVNPIEEAGISLPTYQINHLSLFSHGFLLFITYEEVPEAHDIFIRFTKVFEQTYTRFLDLKKAEAQAREAQIESALERVRSRTMGMQKSDELKDAAILLFQQIESLAVPVFGCGFNIWDDDRKAATAWMAGKDRLQPPFKTSSSEDIFLRIHKAAEKGASLFVEEQSGEALKAHYEYMKSIPIFKEIADKMAKVGQSFPSFQIMHCAYFSQGYLMFISFEPVPEAHDIFKRFAKVFEQTYTRFLDLQKAETQAKEAQIEAGLERARAQSMMMQHSEELNKTSQVFHEQLRILGINSEFSYLWLPDEERHEHLFWATWQEMDEGTVSFKNKQVIYPLDKSESSIAECYVAWESGVPVHVNPVPAKGVEAYFNTWHELLEGVEKFNPELYPDGLYYLDAYMKYGCFGIMIRNKLSKDEQQVLHRFSREFERAYTRFLDLQKAEAQAREAQIETALERVRSRSLAMHSSDELVEASDVMFNQMKELGIDGLRIGIGTINEKDKNVEIWGRSEVKGKVENKIVGIVPFGVHPVFDNMVKAWREKQPYFASERVGEEVKDYYKRLAKYLTYPLPKKYNKRESVTTFFFKAGSLNVISLKPLKKEECDIMIRFAKVFDQTYTRFLDLQKAEAQARESEIQLALERVRARTMAMQKSNELARTAANLFEQMEVLGIKPYRCNIAIVDNANKKLKIWSTTNHGNVIPVSSDIPFNENPVFKEIHKGWKNQKKNHAIKLVGEDRVTWTKYISKYVPFEEYKPKNINKSKLMKEAAFFNNFYFRQGYFIIHTTEEISEEDYGIIQRFANVFEQTYTRFLDLENAEYQNKIIQAENERKTEELEEARQLQLSMLPKDLPKIKNLDIAVYMQTATEVGGDYYDFHVGEDGELTAVIGDATGHGLKAGTVVTITKSLFNNLASEKDVLHSFSKISRVIKDMNFPQLSMCLQMLKINGNKLVMSSAAMPPVLIYRKNKKTVEEVELSGMPLGSMRDFPYKLRETNLNKGDTIFMMSDGYPELMNKNKRMFGYRKVKIKFKSIAEKSAKTIISSLKKSASKWADGKAPDDDVTFVVIKIK